MTDIYANIINAEAYSGSTTVSFLKEKKYQDTARFLLDPETGIYV